MVSIRRRRAPEATRVVNPLKWHGGKHYIATRIVELMPPHIHYVEPFGGGLAVLLAKDPHGVSEVVNDLHGELMNFWRVLQAEESFARFHRRVQAIPFSEAAWQESNDLIKHPDPVDRAVGFFVLCRQSLSGRMRCFAALTRNRTRRQMNEQASAWLNAVDGLPAVHARLRRVAILNRPALQVIKGQDGPKTLFYLDPPYIHDTRASTGEYGEYEMTNEQHQELVNAVVACQGKVMVSMYKHPIYDVLAAKHGWHRREFELPNNAASGSQKRRMTECLWMNFTPPQRCA
jgi:DNA adenine methylase